MRNIITDGNIAAAILYKQVFAGNLPDFYRSFKINTASLPMQVIRSGRDKPASFLPGHGQDRIQGHIRHLPRQLVTAIKGHPACSLQRAVPGRGGKCMNIHTVVGQISIKIHNIEPGVAPLQVHRVGGHIHMQSAVFLVIGSAAGQPGIEQELFPVERFAVQGHFSDISSSRQFPGSRFVYALPADPAVPVRGSKIIYGSLISGQHRFRFNILQRFAVICKLVRTQRQMAFRIIRVMDIQGAGQNGVLLIQADLQFIRSYDVV